MIKMVKTKNKSSKYNTRSVDAYIKRYPAKVQSLLKATRKTIAAVAPNDTTEGISYGIPTFYWHGKYLIYYAAFKSHLSIYPIFRSDPKLKRMLLKFDGSKGSVHFPIDKPLPVGIIKKLVTYRVKARAAETTQRLKKK